MVRLVLLTVLVSGAIPALAAPAPIVVLEDPRGDDRGPGSYTYPSGSEYQPGDFDLRRFSVRVEGKDAVIEVTLGAKVRRDIVPQRGDRGDLDLTNGIYVQNVDIYVDSKPGEGFTEGFPGRGIAFPPASGWDTAIAIVPRPGPTRTALEHWNGVAAQHVATPVAVRSNGPTLTARVPLAQLGGTPQKSWGWSVMVSGAEWDGDFEVVDRLRGAAKPDAFTLPVYGVPEERAFGGGKLNSGNPFVIDVILPPGASQAKVLGTFTASAPAVVPMVYPDPARAAEVEAESKASSAAKPVDAGSPAPSDRPVVTAPTPAAGTSGSELGERMMLKIASVEGDTAVIPAPNGGVNVWQLGAVVDDAGHQVGRVVVTTAANGYLLANITDGKGQVQPGHRVRFAANPR